MTQAHTACEPRRANRVQLGAWVPADTNVPTTVVIATATAIDAVGRTLVSPSRPPTSCSDRPTTQNARTRMSGVETSDTQYMPR